MSESLVFDAEIESAFASGNAAALKAASDYLNGGALAKGGVAFFAKEVDAGTRRKTWRKDSPKFRRR